MCWCEEKKRKKERSKINSYCSIRKYFFTVDSRWWKKVCTAPTPGCKCYWFVHVCRPQNIIVCLGKRCKANCTFSAEKYTWFTVWKLPPQPSHVFTYNNQNETKHKRLVFFTTRHLAVSKCLCAVCQYIIRAFSYRSGCLYSCYLLLRPHTPWEASVTKATVPTGVLLLLLRDIRQAMPNSQEVTSKTMRVSPCVTCFQSTGAKQAVTAHPGVCTQSPRVRHIYTVRLPLWCAVSKWLFRGSLHHPTFFFFFFSYFFVFCSYVSVALLLKTSFLRR